jgi:RNA polymerase sigma factor (sigma-70 family)
LLERPTPRWVQSAIEALHEEAGCWRQPVLRGLTDPNPELAEAMGRLPWSGEWLVRVGETLPNTVTARIRPLAAAWIALRNAFVESHRGLIVAVVRRRSRPSQASHEDLIQEAFLALCRAVERYDPRRGTRFSSYAVPVIRRAIGHAIRAIGEGPAAPHRLSPEAAARIPLRCRGPAGSRQARHRPPALVSLDAAVDALDDTSTLADRLADPEAVPLDIAVIDAIEHARLRDALHAISDEVLEILALHWGLAGEPPWSVQQIGQHVGREASEVDAIIHGALDALRAGLNPAHA